MKKKMYDRRFVGDLYDFGQPSWEQTEEAA